MKKMMTLILVLVLLLSLAACGEDPTASQTPTTQGTAPQNSQPTDGPATAPSQPQSPESTDRLPDLVPDGTYGVDLNAEQVIYDEAGIRITYTGMQFRVGLCDEIYFRVENATDSAINFVPVCVVLNGVSFSSGSSNVVAAGETATVSADIFSSHREAFLSAVEEIRCFDITFHVLTDSNEYGTAGTPLASAVTYVFTQGQHDHRNDPRSILGQLVFENEEIALYVEQVFYKTGDDLQAHYTVINKTDKAFRFSGSIECVYSVWLPQRHFPMMKDMYTTLAPNSYYTGTVTIEDDYAELEMTEILFTLRGILEDACAHAGQEELAQCDFSGEVLSCKTFTLVR